MAVEATIVVEFGDSVESGAFVKVELDDVLNVDSEGNTKTSFYVDDIAHFIVHMDPSLQITRYASTDGNITSLGYVTRSRTEQLLFTNTNDTIEFGYIPAGGYSYQWYGRQATLQTSGRSFRATNSVPALADITASIGAQLFRLTPPSLTLDADESYPIVCVIYVEER